MSGTLTKQNSFKRLEEGDRRAMDSWTYPSGMVWCPMKLSGMAIMKCAELQKRLGCGSLKQYKTLPTGNSGVAPLFWPWLKRSRECPERAKDQEVRELRRALSPLKLVHKSGKNSRACRCPACGGRKAVTAHRCRRCWHLSLEADT